MGFYMSIELQRGGYIGSVSCINQKGNGNGLPFSSVVQISEDGGNSVVTYNAGQNKRPSTRRTLHADDTQSARGGESNAQPSVDSIRQGNANSQEKSSDKVQFSLREPRLPDRDYSYDALTRKPDMTLTVVNDRVKYQPNSVSRKNILEWGIANGKKVGRSNENGNAVVRVKDTGEEVILSKAGLRHGLDRRFAVNAPVVLRAGEILQNAIRINELTPKKDTVDASYVLVGAAKNKNNEPYIVQFVVNRASNEVTSVDVLYAINAKTEPAGSLSPEITGEPATLTDSSISISNLLDYVNRYFPDILPEDVLKHYGHDARPAGELGESALFQQRESRLSNRDVLRMAAGRTPGGCRKG